MKNSSKYLLDADSLIRPFRQHYRPSICPAYWDAIKRLFQEGRLASIFQVRVEIERGKDLLTSWVKDQLPGTFFKKTDDIAVTTQYAVVSNWIHQSASLSDEAKAKFARGADGWLVAYAKANDYLICSYEVPAPQSRNNAKLPDVAAFLGVSCVFPHEMLEELRMRMVLSTRA